MEQLSSPLHIAIRVQTLIELQLSQWQELLIDLQNQKADRESMDYCQTQIDRLLREAQRLTCNGIQSNSSDESNFLVWAFRFVWIIPLFDYLHRQQMPNMGTYIILFLSALCWVRPLSKLVGKWKW